MNNLYEIITSIQKASGSNAKKAILQANKDNNLLREYLRVMLDPAINFYQKAIPKYGINQFSSINFDLVEIDYVVEAFAKRKLTGNTAKAALLAWFEDFATEEDQQLAQWLIERSVGASVGDSMVLSVWPNLYFVPPYQRCSLLDDKAKKKFDKLDKFYVQTKADGSFAYGVTESLGVKLITRNGNKYPDWFAHKILEACPTCNVYVGELEVLEDNKLLERKTGNGILNSIAQDADQSGFSKYTFRLTAWDLLSYQDWTKGKCSVDYHNRFYTLCQPASRGVNVGVIDSWPVSSLQEAYKIYSDHTSRGLEGCVIKDPASLWKDGTSKDIVKLKLKFQGEYKVIGYYEGTGKAKGMLGGFDIASDEHLIISGVGSGFTDQERKYFWDHRATIVGSIITVEANDIVTRRGKDIKSLFLPIFIELRKDKSKADTMKQLQAQLDAAKLGG